MIKLREETIAGKKGRGEGNLKFPQTEPLPFLKSVDNEVREFATDSNLRKYPSKFLTMCQNVVLHVNNDMLEMDFRLIVASIAEIDVASDSQIVNDLYYALVSKLANTRISEFMNARMERELKDQGKVVDADEMLRPYLKAFTWRQNASNVHLFPFRIL